KRAQQAQGAGKRDQCHNNTCRTYCKSRRHSQILRNSSGTVSKVGQAGVRSPIRPFLIQVQGLRPARNSTSLYMKEQDSQSFCCLLLRCGSCLLFLHSEMSSNTAATQLYILTAETQPKINGRRLKFQALSYWRLGHQSRVQAKRVP